MNAITTHVLDTSRGVPASGMDVVLERAGGEAGWEVVGRGATDRDGRLRALLTDPGPAPPGVYRLVFSTGAYFERIGVRTFFPQVLVTFEVIDGDAHHHVPLLVSPFGYSTYRGT